MRIDRKRFLVVLTVTLAFLGAGCENPFTPGLGSGVDLDAPVVRVLSPANGAYVRGTITVSGEWNDDKGVVEGRVTITDQNTSTVQAQLSATINSNKTWSFTLNTGLYPDGEKLVAVVVKDDSGKETETRLLLYFDNSPPVALVNLPADPSAFYNGIVRISGEAYDAFGVQKVDVEIYSDSALTNLLVSGTAEGTSTWNFLFNSATYVTTIQDLYYVVKVLDRAGNPSQVFFHYPEVFALNGNNQITIDKVYQIMNLPNPSGTVAPHTVTQDQLMGSSGIKRTKTILRIDQDSDKPVFTISSPDVDGAVMGPGAKAVGLVEDDDGFNLATANFGYEIVPQSDPFTDTYTPGIVQGSGVLLRFTFTLPGIIGQYKMRLRITDMYGKTGVSNVRTFRVDTGIPLVDINDPGRLYFKEEIVTFTGTASSSGGQVNSMDYSKNGGPWTPIPAANITGLNTPNVTWTMPIDLTGIPNGPFSIAIRATDDNMGNPKIGSSTISLRMDKVNPTSTLITPSTLERIYRQRELRGTTSDNVAVDTVQIQIGADVGWTTPTGTYSWSYTIPNTNTYANTTHGVLQGDGSYQVPVKVKIKDTATNEVTDTHYIYVDPEKDKPIATIISPPVNATLGGNFSVGGTAVDEDPGVGVVEIQLLALQGSTTDVIGAVNPNTGDAATLDTWFPVTFSGGSWNFNFVENVKFYNVGQIGHAYPSYNHSGWYFLRVRARDSQATPVVGEYVERRFRMYNAAQAPAISTNPLPKTHYRSLDTIVISGTAQVPASAVGQIVSEVRVIFDSGTPVVATLTPSGGAATVTWTANVPIPNQGAFNGQKTVTIEADGRNQANDITMGYANVYVNIDTMLPSASLLSPTSSQVVYRDVTLTGTASDNSAVQTVEIRVGNGGTWGSVTGLYGWSHAIANANTLANAAQATWSAAQSAWEVPVQIRVTDVAGNQTVVNSSFFVNPDNDKPTVSVITPPVNGIMPGNFTATGIAFDERPGLLDVQYQLVALQGTTTTEIGAVDPVTGNAVASSVWYTATLSGGQWTQNFTEQVKLYNVGLTGHAYPGSNHEGWFLLKVRARDSQATPVLSDVVTRRFRLFKDPLAPTVTINTLSNIYYRGTQVVTLSGTATVPAGHPDMNIKSGTGIQVSFDGSAYTASGVSITPNPDMKNVNWTANYTLPALPAVNGTKTFTVKGITVNAVGTEAEGFASTFVIIDSTPPTSAFTNPAPNATVYGMVSLRGSTSDNNQVTGVEIRIGNQPTWITIPSNLYNWTYNFDANLRANATDATWDSVENVWILPIQQRVTDIAGNVYTQTGYQLKIDTDLDKPTVQFIAPQDGANIAGPALINGTAYDENPGLLRVEMRIAALEGETGTTIVNSGNGYVDFAGNASPSTTWHTVTGTTLWNKEINTNGRFYNVGKAGMAYPALPDTGPGSHAGRFLLEVRAVDGNNKIGNSVTRIIRFDDSIPKFESMSISQYSYVKGILNITGTLSDDEQLNAAQISFDGGTTYTNLVAGTDYTVVDVKTYNLHISINTETDVRIPAAILANKNGILNLRLRATDNANYQNIHYLDLYVDNYFPSGAFTIVPGVTPDDLNNTATTRALLRGSASDDGPGVTVKDISKVEVYFTRGPNVLRISDGATQAYTNVDFGNGQGLRPYTTDPAYKVEILRTHIYAVDYKEIELDGGNFIWKLGLDSTKFSDGALTIHFVIHDKAGNRTHNTQAGFVKNNKPVISSVTTGTDLNYSDVVEAWEQFTYTGSFNARNRLYLQINATGGNGTLNYAVLEGATPVAGAPSGTNNSGTVNISALGDGPRTYTLRVTDGVGIVVEQNFVYSVLQTDSVAPTITINVAEQSHVPVSAGVPQGHLEEIANNPLNPGVRPAVSGSILIKGMVNDNMRIREIRLTVDGVGTNVLMAQWDTVAKTLVSQNANFVIDSQNMSVTAGHTVYYTYTWQTHTVTNSAGLNIPLTMSAQDYRAGPPPAVTASRNYDVVPYITSITTTQIVNGGIKAQNIRSASGAYSIKTGTTANFITINGFNLRPITNGVRISSSARPSGLNGTTLQGYALTFTAPAAPYTTLTTQNNGTSGSGYLNVIAGTAAAPVPTINNINNNTLPQNKEPNPAIGNLLLTDDRYINFFTVTNTGLTNSFFPKMMMDTDGVTPLWGYVQSSAANDLQVRRGTDSTNNIGIVRILSADQLALARDEDNRYHMISINNFNFGRMVYFNHLYDSLHVPNGAATSPYWAGYPGQLSSWASNNALDLDSNNIGGLTLSRVNNINLVAKGRSNTAGQYARLYMAWYDNVEGNLYFRNWRVGLGVTGGHALFTGYGQSNLNDVNVTTRDGSAKLVTSAASAYLAMGVTDQNYVIIVYFDQTDGYLKLVHSATTAGGSTPAAVDLNNPVTDVVYWSTPRNIAPQYTGWYVSMLVQNDNNAATPDPIHIAAYDSAGADLMYVYLTSFSDTVQKVARVDAKFSVGIYTDIKVNGGRPWIAYYNNSENGTRDSIKLARYNGTLPTVLDGANVDETVTGNWETMTVPVNTVPQGGLNKFIRVNLDFNSSNRPIVGFAASQLEYSTLLAETP